jgi:DNA-binding transcriptional regulator YdaS (Cro superfamily)
LQWAAGRPVPVKYMAAIELFTGGDVTRQEMCPDEWHKIWPELVSRKRSEQLRALGMAA